MREAFLIVAQLSQDLAIIPLTDAEQLLHSLRSLQPDLKMILTTADSNQELPNEYQNTFQGLLHTADLETELPALLGSNRSKKELARFGQELAAVSTPGLIRLQAACQEFGLTKNASPVQMAVLSHGGRVIGFCGQGNETQALEVAVLVSRSWQKKQFSAQLQYLQLPDYYDARLIYSRGVAGVVLSLVAEPEVPIGDMRKLADRLARRLSDSKEEAGEPVKSHFIAIGRNNGSISEGRPSITYAIAWRPIKPLPVALESVVRNCISALAGENGCYLRHLSVTPAIVHLVIDCPAGRTAAWVAFIMKSGINNEIKRQFGTQSLIWHKGFYAAESAQPLSEAELNMLLTR
jgi:hypothetical protein